MCFAFSFECSVMPLHSASKIRDYNGTRSYKACLYCLLIVMSYYTVLMLNSIVYGQLNDAEDCHSKFYSLDLLTIVLISRRNDTYSNASCVLILTCILMQCVLQLLYTFYESRTNIHILFEELLYRDTSVYVNRIRWQHQNSASLYRIGTRTS